MTAMLIGGTSHCGKSTVAAHIAEERGWRALSTDRLARHPGRPWGGAPAHVAEHYGQLSTPELMGSVLEHYGRMWPLVEEALRGRSEAPLVLEGSALLPDLVAASRLRDCVAVWLTAPPQLLERRIRAESGYAAAGPEARALIDKFFERTLAFDRLIRTRTAALGLPTVEVADGASASEVATACAGAARTVG